MEYRYDELPAALKEQLSARAKPDPRRENILHLLRKEARPLTVDEILIGLWQQSGEAHKRNQVQISVADLVDSGLIVAEGHRHKKRIRLTERAHIADQAA